MKKLIGNGKRWTRMTERDRSTKKGSSTERGSRESIHVKVDSVSLLRCGGTVLELPNVTIDNCLHLPFLGYYIYKLSSSSIPTLSYQSIFSSFSSLHTFETEAEPALEVYQEHLKQTCTWPRKINLLPPLECIELPKWSVYPILKTRMFFWTESHNAFITHFMFIN